MAKAFERVVTRSLRRRPAERYAKAQDMLDDLSKLASEAM